MITAQDMIELAEKNAKSVETKIQEKVQDIELYIKRAAGRGSRDITEFVDVDISSAVCDHFRTAGFEVSFRPSTENIGFLKINW